MSILLILIIIVYLLIAKGYEDLDNQLRINKGIKDPLRVRIIYTIFFGFIFMYHLGSVLRVWYRKRMQ